jgi:hypothetical protein
MIAHGGFTNYGEDLGILMLDTRFPRIPGDVGNAKTFPFTVRYLTVKGAIPSRIVWEPDPTLLQPFVDGARELERLGVKAITTSCGFLAMFQRELATAVEIPVFSSSLLQIPFLYGICGRQGKAGILTARKASLGAAHFEGCGIRDIPLAVGGMDDSPEFTRVFLHWGDKGGEDLPLDVDMVRNELCAAARDLVAGNPDIRFVVLECTNMPPFRLEIQRACGRPVYDIVTLANYVHSGLLKGILLS